MPRPSRNVPISKRGVQLPDALWEAIDALNFNPATGKPVYGSGAAYFERIVKQDLRRLDRFVEMIDDLEAEE